MLLFCIRQSVKELVRTLKYIYIYIYIMYVCIQILFETQIPTFKNN